MALAVTLYTLAKDQNSTRLPDTGGVSMDVTLKDQCSIMEPALLFDAGPVNFPGVYNYCYLPAFGRYYWITNWQYFRGCWLASCRVDVLASWRAVIGESMQYIVRSSAASDPRIIDSLYPLGTEVQEVEQTFDNPLSVDDMSAGTYVVGIVNSDNNQVIGGGVSYYTMTQTEFDAFRNYLLSDVNYLDISADEISGALSKALFNPFQYVASVKWFPVAPSGTPVTSVPFGWWAAPVSASRLDTPYSTVQEPVIVLQDHPQASTMGRFCNAAPATGRYLYVEPFGFLPLDSTLLSNYTFLAGFADIDYITGRARLTITARKGTGAAETILYRYGQVGVDIQLAGIYANMPTSGSDIVSSGVKALVSGIGDAASNLLGGRSPTWEGVTSAAQSAVSDAEVMGSPGSFLPYVSGRIVLINRFQLFAQSDPERRGRPLMQRRKVSTLPGFLVCDRPHIECAATADEIGAIESAMSSGFIWE